MGHPACCGGAGGSGIFGVGGPAVVARNPSVRDQGRRWGSSVYLGILHPLPGAPWVFVSLCIALLQRPFLNCFGLSISTVYPCLHWK